jgi:hypothetical protein
MHLPFVVALVRYRQHPLYQGAVGWLLERYETKEGANGGKAQIAGLDAYATLGLEIGEERTDERRVQIFEFQGRRSLACANVNSWRNVSLYDVIVLALTSR